MALAGDEVFWTEWVVWAAVAGSDSGVWSESSGDSGVYSSE